jgi:nitroimidazol reductase NimA-like FMN-containing flavoprotein (pyridoxamine 5'-phosphate oxidase superfamily)
MKTAAPEFSTLDDTQARDLLARNHVGRIAYSRHDRVDIEPVHYVYDGDWLFGRTSAGAKLATLLHRPWCAFEVDEVRAMFDWSSVVVKGSFHLLDPETGSPDTYDRALESVSRLLPETFTVDDPAPHRTLLFGIFIHFVDGRAATTHEP